MVYEDRANSKHSTSNIIILHQSIEYRKLPMTMSTLKDITDQELATLKGRTVIVTGGASGIGKATVLIAHCKTR